MATLINGQQGFLITGWFKPTQEDEGTAVEYKKFHVSSLEPAITMTNDQLDARCFVAVTTSTPLHRAVRQQQRLHRVFRRQRLVNARTP